MDTRPEKAPVYSPSFDRALMVAALVHARQKRKGTEVPYLTHPAHVAMLLARRGFAEPVLVAAVLHDVLEDLDAENLDVQRSLRESFPGLSGAPEDKAGFHAAFHAFLDAEFPPEVMVLVEAMTDEKTRPDGSKVPWAEAKKRSHQRLARPDTPELAVVLKAADALHNSRQIVNDLRTRGLSTMKRFNAAPEDTLSHYAEVWRVASARLSGGPGEALAEELLHSVREMAEVLDLEFRKALDGVLAVAGSLPPGRRE